MQFQALQLFIFSLYFFVVQQLGFRVFEDTSEENSLILVHVLFRHGNRTANGPEELYPKDPYVNETYYPVGLGQLTNAGKVKEYSLGKALRQRYNRFLGKHYYPEIVESWSTDYNRTKMSLELVLAGLFPPQHDQIWNQNLDWQPVPYNYHQRSQDKVLLGVMCPYYLQLYDETIQFYNQLNQFDEYAQIFQYISYHTGLNITKFLDVYNLYFGLVTEEEWGFPLPEWTKAVWPDTIIDLTIKEYFISTMTTELNQMANGYFLKKIVTDTLDKINSPNSGRKIYLYSAHESNIAELLIFLDVFQHLHIPSYGAYVAIEVHYINNQYGIKIFYENYEGNEPELLKLPACETFCEINKFIALIEEYFPSEDLCYQID